MTPASSGGRAAGAMEHHPKAMPEPHGVGWRFRAACSCGWTRQETNTKRENAVRAARRHAREASQ